MCLVQNPTRAAYAGDGGPESATAYRQPSKARYAVPMCANYLPSSREELTAFPLPPPDFGYGEAYPGSIVPIVTTVAPCLWVPASFGLVPMWAKDARIVRSTYNARSETVGEKPSFCSAWKRGQLCIIPAAAIFEPCYESGNAVRWRIERADGKPMGIAGIWERRLQDDVFGRLPVAIPSPDVAEAFGSVVTNVQQRIAANHPKPKPSLPSAIPCPA